MPRKIIKIRDAARGTRHEPHLTKPDEETPDMATHSNQVKNGHDQIKKDHSAYAIRKRAKFYEKVGEIVGNNWQWAVGAMVAAGYLAMPATRWELDKLKDKVDSNHEQVVGKLDELNRNNERVNKTLDKLDGYLFNQRSISVPK